MSKLVIVNNHTLPTKPSILDAYSRLVSVKNTGLEQKVKVHALFRGCQNKKAPRACPDAFYGYGKAGLLSLNQRFRMTLR